MIRKKILALTLILLPHQLLAQSLTITSPASPVNVPEGDDFATDELGNAWDFSERRDIGWEENFSGPSMNVNGGIWTGTNQVPGGYIFPLFPGFARGSYSEGLSGDKTLPKLGINHRINAAKYYYLSYRLNHSSRSTFAIYWENDQNKPEYWPEPNSPQGASSDAFYHWNQSYRISGFNTYSFDMRNSASIFEQKKGTWSGYPFALRLDPSTGGPIGSTTQLDWMRLVDPASAPNQTITWNSSNISPFSVITVNYDTDASGFDGTPLARFTTGSNPGAFTFPTAMLPPGNYYFYITAQTGSGGSLTGPITYSGYSNRLTIVPKPSGHITAPSMTSGEEYSSSVVNNPWDMDGPADIANLNRVAWPNPFRQFSSETFVAGNPDSSDGGSVFAAVANPPINGAFESDVQIHLNVSKAKPMDTGKFRYLTYRLAVDENGYPTLHDKISKGWVMRPIWWNGAFSDAHDRAKAHILYEGWHEYGTDLSDSSIMEYGSPWNSELSFDNLRIDPLEVPTYTWFYLDYVRLYSENRAPSGFYDIKYSVDSVGTGTVTTSIYYDTNNTGFDGTLITTLSNQSAGNYTYRWNTSGLPTGGSYYVYLIISNGTNSVKMYSPVHLKIGPYVAAQIVRPDFDFDGDGKSDQAVFRATPGGLPKKNKRGKIIGYTPYKSGSFLINNSRTSSTSATWGNSKYSPLFADIDGDGRADRGLVVPINGILNWYFVRSSNGSTLSKIWGVTGDKIVLGDYNGNGTDEIAIYRDGAWWILDEQGNGYVRYWGQAGTDQPVPADYDGDGKTDIAIWRKTDGYWWILYSGYGNGFSSVGTSNSQWGLPSFGDIPVAGDYTGDGRADLAVFRPLDGTWYVKNLVNDSIISQQWGINGDVPLAEQDVNGDGTNDFTVFRPSTGTWFYNLRNGGFTSKQYGVAGDLIPIKISRN